MKEIIYGYPPCTCLSIRKKGRTAIKEYYSKSVYRPTQKDPVKHTMIEHLFYIVDEIAKKVSEGV